MKENDKELSELLSQLGLEPDETCRTLQEIRKGDEFFDQADALVNDTAVLERLEQRIHQELNHPASYPPRWKWRRLAVAAALAIISLVGLKLWFGLEPTQPQTGPTDQPIITYNVEDEVALWELALLSQDNPEMEFDELLMTEVIILFDEVNWEMENIFGKENSNEIYNTTAAGFDRPGTRCV
jgi:hypothetical protein